MSEVKPRPKPSEQQFNKSGCELQQFPVIKMHIFPEIQILNLSNNYISNLDTLQIHNTTSKHALIRLKHVDLSHNLLLNVALLEPLALAAKNLHTLNISDNPLVRNLNFLYEIALIFASIKTIQCSKSVVISQEVRERMVKQQLVGGRIMSEFLRVIKLKTESLKFIDVYEEAGRVQDMLNELKVEGGITEQNDRIFQQMDLLISWSGEGSSRSHTYRSPTSNRNHQIEAHSEYQIRKQQNQLKKYLTQNDQSPVSLTCFYYQQIIYKQSIYAKILQEIEVQEKVEQLIVAENKNPFTFSQLFGEVSKKWTNNFKLTSLYQPEMASHHSSAQLQHSPLKSVQTDITSKVSCLPIASQSEAYFGLDQQWTDQTYRFVRHRLLSLLNAMQKESKNQVWSSPKPISTINPYSNQSPDFQARLPDAINYQTFGVFGFESGGYSDQKVMMSPKSRNKFIIGSLVNILEQVVKKIALRRMWQARSVKQQDVLILYRIVGTVARRSSEIAFRKIFEASIFYECLELKMSMLKKKAVFKAWKQLKRRKLKLIKSFLARKFKKENAFLSVFFTQYRIHSRNISFEQRLRQSKTDFEKQSNDLENVSVILKRSATCQRNLTIKTRVKQPMQIKRSFLKVTKQR